MSPFSALSPSMVVRIKAGLFAGTVIATGSLLPHMAHTARAADLDALEEQIAHIQAEQRALQKALVSVQQQIAAHRATHGGEQGSGHHLGHNATSTLHAVRDDAELEEPREEEPGLAMPAHAHAMAMNHHHATGPDAQPIFSGVHDAPDVESVVGHRAEDVVARLADNNVGAPRRGAGGGPAAGGGGGPGGV
ncbi:MAG: hypothetical protein ABF577_13570, partial [Acetobacter sp.]